MVTSLLHYFHNCIYNIRISSTAAKVTTHQFFNIFDVFGFTLIEHTYSRAYLSRRTIAALESIVFYKCHLQWMQLVAIGQAFDSGDLGTIFHYCECKATVDAFTIDQYRTGAAL